MTTPSPRPYAERAYLEYALSVVKGRALPDVCDGQKPVQRRILYAWSAWAWRSRQPAAPKPVKSARVVGDVLGRFHPHGDQAAYDALVRMAQDFSQRYPLIDGQGNFGSRDGDGAAAMRYTEARLAPITRPAARRDRRRHGGLHPQLRRLDRGAASQLPARLPFVLLNGASGIAVGLATEMPSHNLREVAAAAVALMKNDSLGDDELLRADPGARLPRRRPDHQQRRRHPRRLRHRARLAQGARALEDRGAGARPVAAGRHRTAAGRQHAEGAGRDRGADQPEGQGRQEGADARADCSSRPACSRCSTRCATSRAAKPRCGWCSSRRRARIEQQDLITALLAHTSLESSAPINLTMIGARRPADAEEPAPDARRVDRLPPADDAAAHAAPAGQGAGPHPHPRGAAARAAQHRRGDPHHPPGRRAEAGADRGVQPERAPGRRHPRDPPAPAGAAGGDQDRAGARRRCATSRASSKTSWPARPR